MITKNRLVLATAGLLASITLAQAQNPQDHEAHHPAGQPTTQTERPASPSGTQTMPMRQGGMMGSMQAGPGGQGMMMGGDMSQMMRMMQGCMMQGGPGMEAMGMGAMGSMATALQHIDGVIAYYKAELHITDAQAPQWNAYADALRSSAARMREAMGAAASTATAGGLPPAPEQMERRINLLSAHLDALKSVEAAAKPLYAVLSDDQKKTADQLIAEHFMRMPAGGL